MKLRENRRQPFFGEAVDRELLGPDFKPALEELAEIPADLAELQTLEHSGDWADIDPAVSSSGRTPGFDPENAGSNPAAATHPDFREMGTNVALGFIPHRGENRQKRREGVKTWKATPEQLKAVEGGPPLPTRREMFEQRKKHKRGKLDPVLRRLQRERLKKK